MSLPEAVFRWSISVHFIVCSSTFCRRDLCALVAHVQWSGASYVTQFARIECRNKFSFAVEARSELVNKADHLTLFNIARITKKLLKLFHFAFLRKFFYRYLTVWGRTSPVPSKVNSHSVKVTDMGFMKLKVTKQSCPTWGLPRILKVIKGSNTIAWAA